MLNTTLTADPLLAMRRCKEWVQPSFPCGQHLFRPDTSRRCTVSGRAFSRPLRSILRSAALQVCICGPRAWRLCSCKQHSSHLMDLSQGGWLPTCTGTAVPKGSWPGRLRGHTGLFESVLRYVDWAGPLVPQPHVRRTRNVCKHGQLEL